MAKATQTAYAVDWLDQDKLFLLECWARDMTQQDIARKIGILPQTLSVWARTHPSIKQAIARGREIVDYKIESAVFKAAIGFTLHESKITTLISDDGKEVVIKKEETSKEVAPNVTACALWLNNRKPDNWKRNRDVSVETKEDEKNITVNIINHGKANTNDDNDDWDVSAK